MIVCYAFPSGVGGRFISATGTIGAIGGGGGNGTTGNGVLVAFGNYDLLRRL